MPSSIFEVTEFMVMDKFLDLLLLYQVFVSCVQSSRSR